MSNERNSHRTAVILFAVTMIIAILAAFVTTLERVKFVMKGGVVVKNEYGK